MHAHRPTISSHGYVKNDVRHFVQLPKPFRFHQAREDKCMEGVLLFDVGIADFLKSHISSCGWRCPNRFSHFEFVPPESFAVQFTS
jgi:hypothetical protein